MKRLLYILTILTLFNGCSKDDPIVQPEENLIDGGIIKRLSLVKITNDDVFLEEYRGSIGNTEILFYKSDNKELLFSVPNSIEVGENILEIPALSNLKIKYQVIDQELVGTPEENIASFFSNIDGSLLKLENIAGFDNLNNYVKNLNDYFNNASETEKIKMAKYYKVNQKLFDAVLNKDYFSKSPIINDDAEILFKFKAAVLTSGVSAAYAWLSPPDPSTKAIAVVVAIVAAIVANNYFKQFSKANLIKINTIIDNVTSNLSSKTNLNSELKLFTNEEETFSLEFTSRPIIKSDESKNNQNISDFFYSLDDYDTIIEKTNTVISFVNDKLFFSNISLLEIPSLEDSKPVLKENASDLFFNNASFSIQSSNINLENIAFKDGKLNVKLKIIDESVVNEFVETKLNYSYKDDFNEISGSFPLKVFKCSPTETTVVIESNQHHLGDNFGNEGIVFSKEFEIENLCFTSAIFRLSFGGLGPNSLHPPTISINGETLSPSVVSNLSTPGSDSCWTGPHGDGSFDYDCSFTVEYEISDLLTLGTNTFKIQNGVPADDYFFKNVYIELSN